MTRLLLRTLWLERSRMGLSLLAVGAAVALVVVLEGFRSGLERQVAAYAEHLDADLVVAQGGVRNIIAARSVVTGEVQRAVDDVDGVEAVHRLIGAPVIFGRGDRKTPIYLVGYDAVGGPWELAAGRTPERAGEATVDSALARTHDMELGDRITLLGEPFEVVGTSAGTSAGFNPFVFVTFRDARRLVAAEAGIDGGASLADPQQLHLELPSATAHVDLDVEPWAPDLPVASYLLVDTRGGPRSVARAIRRDVDDVEILTPRTIARNDVAMIREIMAPALGLLIGVSYVIGVLVIGLTLHASTAERLRELGVMRALGGRLRHLASQVLGQAAVLALAGIVVGIVMAFGASALVTVAAPQYEVVVWDTGVLARTVLATLVMALVASLLPLRHAARVDPMLVFREH